MMVITKKIIKKILKNLGETYFILKSIVYHKKYPQNQNGKVYIHLGCGEINSKGYINVDGRAFPHIHHISNVTNLSMFKDSFADLIYASHVLEHLSISNIKVVLEEWKRVLKPGGILRLGVPDFDTIIQIYNENNKNIDLIWRPLLGGQEYKQNFHFAIFNESYLESLLKDSGFSEIRKWVAKEVDHHDFEDWTSIEYKVNETIYPISLNVEAMK